MARKLRAEDMFATITNLMKVANDSATPINPDSLKPKAKVIPKNHKLFIIDNKEIYALNLANAYKKFNKLKQSEKNEW